MRLPVVRFAGQSSYQYSQGGSPDQVGRNHQGVTSGTFILSGAIESSAGQYAEVAATPYGDAIEHTFGRSR